MSQTSDKPTADNRLIQIDLDAVVRSRMPRHYKFIPGFLIRWLSRVVCQDQLNEMLRVCEGKEGADFCRGVIDHLDITYSVEGQENINPSDRRVIIVSNHPLGGLDGMMMIDYFSRLYGGRLKFIVNDLLMVIKPLGGVFLPINKHGHQSRESFRAIESTMAGDDPVIIFPAGLVSRKGKKGVVADLQWQKNFVNKALQHKRDIIPVYFSGQNSKFFYNFAKTRSRLGLKFNIEMVRLPKEVFRARGKSYSIHIGKPIKWQSLKGGAEAQATADELRRLVYGLASE